MIILQATIIAWLWPATMPPLKDAVLFLLGAVNSASLNQASIVVCVILAVCLQTGYSGGMGTISLQDSHTESSQQPRTLAEQEGSNNYPAPFSVL